MVLPIGHDNGNEILGRFAAEPSLPLPLDAFVDGEQSELYRHQIGNLSTAWPPAVVKALRDSRYQPGTFLSGEVAKEVGVSIGDVDGVSWLRRWSGYVAGSGETGPVATGVDSVGGGHDETRVLCGRAAMVGVGRAAGVVGVGWWGVAR